MGVMYVMVMVVKVTGSKVLHNWDMQAKTTRVRGMRGREMGAKLVALIGREAVTWSNRLETMVGLAALGLATDG